MADLEALIRLRKHRVEEKQKVLGEILREIEELENKKNTLLARIENERKALDENAHLETREYYGRFEGVIRGNVERIDAEIATFEARLTLAQEEVRQAFADQKRVEIVNERRIAEEAAERDKKESLELDEIGIEGFRRQEEF